MKLFAYINLPIVLWLRQYQRLEFADVKGQPPLRVHLTLDALTDVLGCHAVRLPVCASVSFEDWGVRAEPAVLGDLGIRPEGSYLLCCFLGNILR